jgi:L,D-transpeptidase ErfK/SrfK
MELETNIQTEHTVPDPVIPETRRPGLIGFAWGLVLGLLLAVGIALYALEFREVGLKLMPFPPERGESRSVDVKTLAAETSRLEKRVVELRSRLDKLIPAEPFMVISTTENLFSLRTKKRLLYEGSCSTGSYTILRTHDGREEWQFQTPRGMLRVRNILSHPIWRMPDWAFVEEGLPIPSGDSPERYEQNVLGEWGFDIGNGYLIHGTLYQRFLGLPVTHGCVRLGDEELRVVHKNIRIGSKVFIY